MNRLAEIIAADAEQICKKVDLTEISEKVVIVTGASGLVGGYFLACLKHLSHSMHMKFRAAAVMQSEPHPYLIEFLDYNGAEVLRGDLTDYDFCRSLPQADYIIHAAGYGQPGRFMENPVKTIQLNTSATCALFEKLREKGKFLFISTSEVYSGLTNPPHKESEIGTTNTTHPRACYIEAKRCGEAICNAYRLKNVQAKSARLALAYGPGTRPGDMRVINSFIQKALQGRITLLDQGKAKRTYCYVSDAVEIMWNILLKGRESVYNVGGFSKTTVGDLARKIGEYLNVPVIFPDGSESIIAGAPDDVFLDMAKAQNEFGKTEYVIFDDGLERTIEWQKILYDNESLRG